MSDTLDLPALTVQLSPAKGGNMQGGDTICFPLFPLFLSIRLSQSVTMTLLGQEVSYVPIVVPQSVVSLCWSRMPRRNGGEVRPLGEDCQREPRAIRIEGLAQCGC